MMISNSSKAITACHSLSHRPDRRPTFDRQALLAQIGARTGGLMEEDEDEPAWPGEKLSHVGRLRSVPVRTGEEGRLPSGRFLSAGSGSCGLGEPPGSLPAIWQEV